MDVRPPVIPTNLKKPIVLLVGFFAGGVIFGRFAQPPVILLVLLFGVLVFASVLLYRIHSRSLIPVLWALVFVLGLAYFMSAYYPRSTDVVHLATEPIHVELVGRVASSPKYSDDGTSTSYLVEVEQVFGGSFPIDERFSWDEATSTVDENGQVDAHMFSGKVWVTSFQSRSAASLGDRVRLEGRLFRPRSFENEPLGTSWVSYLAYQGVWTQLYAQEVTRLVKARPPLYRRCSSYAATRVASIIERSLLPTNSSVIEAMILGLRERLPSDVVEAFQTTGTAHVLVVSGLHVGLVLLGVFAIGRALQVSSRRALMAALAAMLAYAYVTGMRTPALRASLMACIGGAGYLLDRRVPGMTVLCLAGFIILLLDPLALFSASFQLSFIAVGGIVHLAPYFVSRFCRLPSPLRQLLSVSIAAQLSILPLLAVYFGQLPLVGFLSNLIVVPLMSVLAIVSFAAVGLGFITLPLSWPLFYLVEILSGVLVRVVGVFSACASHVDFLWLSPTVSVPPLWIVFVYYGLLIVLPMTTGNEQGKLQGPKKSGASWLSTLRLPRM